ncbi:hypothetical protein DL98DRAFT_45964 [Cadophora sp. DSE1049]|nr:hypothetical protein DL98DRAFT_45964 [Cadophora sp. DSE1049]
MSFEELYQHARGQRYWGTTGTPRRKTGRIRTIKWLCENEGIVPFVAPIVASSVEASPVIARFTVRPTGAISHPEANLCTNDPELQKLIDIEAAKYIQWPNTELLTLAMQRSYQLLKDSNSKLPSRSTASLSRWFASWDILKSPREKNCWLGDGIDLVNKAKALGYQGRSTKYEVIVWLRTTAEEVHVEVKEIKEPTPNKKPKKRMAEGVPGKEVSKRPAKGSKRPNGWHDPNP